MRKFLALLLLAAPAFAVPPSLTVTVGAGNVPTATWDAPWASGCTASGSWTGAKAKSGTQVLPAISATATYTLTCTSAADTQAVLSWVAPTQNTDGSTLTDLAGFRVYSGAATGSLTMQQQIANPATLTFTATGLSVGTRYFAVTAYNTAGVESARSATGSKTITAAQTDSATVTLRVPDAPLLTIPIAKDMRTTPVFRVSASGRRSWFAAGYVRVGAVCSGDVLFTYRGYDYRRVSSNDVHWYALKSNNGAAACG